MLCGALSGLKCRVCFGLGRTLLQGSSEDWELLVGLQASERLLSFLEAGGGPPEGHLRVAPSLDVSGDGSHRAKRRAAPPMAFSIALVQASDRRS